MLNLDSDVEKKIITLGAKLRDNNLKLATAESCTGGMIGTFLTSVAGSSDWFNGGIIAYSNEIKNRLLSVSKKTLLNCGAVSEETVKEMASGAADILKADIAVSVSGVAGPGGGSEEKPVGLVYIGLFNRGDIAAFRYKFDGNRDSVREQTVKESVKLILSILE